MNEEHGSSEGQAGPDYKVATRATAQSKPTDIGAGVTLSLPVEVRAEYSDRTVTMTVDLVDDRLNCTSIVVQGKKGVAVTGEMLRAVPVAEMTTIAGIRAFASIFDPGDGWFPKPEGFPKSGPTDEALRYISAVYSLAYIVGQPPTKAVQSTGLTYPTAARWVALARAAGHLGQTEPGRASGTPRGTGREMKRRRGDQHS